MRDPVGRPVLVKVRAPLRAIGEVVLPRPDFLDEEAWAKAQTVVEEALVRRPPGVGRQVRLFLRMVNLLPILTTGRTLVKLSHEGRVRFLHRLERSPVKVFRRGMWGVRTLVFMGCYTQEAVRSRIGYRAHPDGWKVLREQSASSDLREPSTIPESEGTLGPDGTVGFGGAPGTGEAP